MKIFLLTLLLAVCSSTGFSQQAKRTVYLTVWFDKSYWSDEGDYVLLAETGNISVPEVSELVLYTKSRKAKPADIYFYSDQNDSAKRLYNRFNNPTAGLEYLGKYGWQLVTIVNEKLEDYKYPTSHRLHGLLVYISTRPVYYLKKEVD